MHFSWKTLLLALCLVCVPMGQVVFADADDAGDDAPPTIEPAEQPDNTSYRSRHLEVSSLYAGGITWTEIINNLLTVLAYTIFYVAASAFLLGALMYTAGFINEEYKSKGKNLMIGSLTGMALVLAARAIFNAAYFFVYGI